MGAFAFGADDVNTFADLYSGDERRGALDVRDLNFLDVWE